MTPLPMPASAGLPTQENFDYPSQCHVDWIADGSGYTYYVFDTIIHNLHTKYRRPQIDRNVFHCISEEIYFSS